CQLRGGVREVEGETPVLHRKPQMQQCLRVVAERVEMFDAFIDSIRQVAQRGSEARTRSRKKIRDARDSSLDAVMGEEGDDPFDADAASRELSLQVAQPLIWRPAV